MAERLNVVRQTISKWEKGLSVPDADMLIRLDGALEVPVRELLGDQTVREENEDEITEQLVKLNEQMAARNQRTRRIVRLLLGIVLLFFAVNLVLAALGMVSFQEFQEETSVEVEQIPE